MKPYLNLANAVTTGSLAAGFAAMLLAFDGRLGWATAAVGLAAVLDILDGPVARLLDCCGRFGGELDSLADLVAFGVAPAFILYHGPLDGDPLTGVGPALAFLIAGAWRLARFPMVQSREHFVGLPIPPAALTVAAASLWLPAVPAVAITLVLALLMVSTLPFPTQQALGRLFLRRATPAPVRHRIAPAPEERARRRRRRVTIPRRRGAQASEARGAP